MSRGDRRVGMNGLRQAFDEVRFGAQRTLNLRESFPTAHEATTRAEAWLRQQQMDRADEVLIITGRGNQSHDGVSVVREAVIRLLHALKRRGVVNGHEEHTAGSFVVTLAPPSALFAEKQKGGAVVKPPPRTPPSLDNLDPDTRLLLRNLAERTLEGVGIKDTATFLQGEMLRLFGELAAKVGDVPDREKRFRDAVLAMLDQTE